MNTKRMEIARLHQRFGFGPRPGEFAASLKMGVEKSRSALTTIPASDPGADAIAEPVLTDLGPRPKPNSADVVPFALGMRNQSEKLSLWWLDRMALSNHGLSEKMTWFWHGHWATSITKVDYPLTMFKQNQTLRKYALGNFNEMSRAMLNDGALQFWLDGQDSTAKAPNENLARELMELFILGVDRYTEDDVKALAKVLTGYQVVKSNGTVTFNPKRHDSSAVTLLGTNRVFTGESVVDYLVARDDCPKFIAERFWYRFISSTEPMPANFSAVKALSSRNISQGVLAMTNDSALKDARFALVKSPVEWFISACRALELTPSLLEKPAQLNGFLNKLGQIPFSPPNVGGWPAGEAWLSSASAQYRISFATWLVKQSSLRGLLEISEDRRVMQSADWLGVAEWSARTQAALRNSVSNPQEFAVLALCSPEYVVSA
ncbi:DUF1800 domain-containing protein [Candidatus Planktophila sulfonica]|uniref:DUF1800 domain-containing protein n=1 Tax=Candidatus Planktophila sulfonica TaxID=1884904 RepID=A0A249KEW9_9ACTN|nr:DUF1800 domain-containing protein [Candidatus Planktophila sulfonica]ASY15342.1 DUF1800 domain-containing protein [Candidatus Planktophila sulfonica]